MTRAEVLDFMQQRHHTFNTVMTKDEVFAEVIGDALYISPNLLTMGTEPLKKVSLFLHGLHEPDEIDVV